MEASVSVADGAAPKNASGGPRQRYFSYLIICTYPIISQDFGYIIFGNRRKINKIVIKIGKKYCPNVEPTPSACL